MTSILKIVGVAMVVGVLCVGAVALATDFTWDSLLADTSWLAPTNWDQDSSYPQNVNDNATIEAAGFLCTYDPGSALTINNLALAGDSPTRRKLHIKDAALTVDGVATLGDYAELDVDRNLTIDDTDMSGNIWVNVADSTTVDLGTTVDILGTAGGSGISCTLHLKDNTTGTFKGATVTIDADTPDVTRGLKFTSSDSTFDVTVKLVLKSDQTSGTKRAKLWIAAGTINIDDGGAGNGILEVDGGDDSLRRAELDIDDTLSAEETDFESGYATIDVASGATATGGDVVFKVGAIVTKTGPGKFRSGA